MKLDHEEVLVLYEYLSQDILSPDHAILREIRNVLRRYILDCLRSPALDVDPEEPIEGPMPPDELDMFSRLELWEESLSARLNEKQQVSVPTENPAFDLFEEYDSAYPKSFKRQRARPRKQKK
jgi:hypothetical protein